MLAYVCDLETNGLLHELDHVHSLVLRDAMTGEVISCTNETSRLNTYHSIAHGLDLLAKADVVIGHNFINFDARAIAKVYPSFQAKPDSAIHDTLIIGRVLSPEMEMVDDQKYPHIPPKYRGKHSLAAWGERLGVEKIKFTENEKKSKGADVNVWDKWSEEMQVYCEQDTLVTQVLYEYFQTQRIGLQMLRTGA